MIDTMTGRLAVLTLTMFLSAAIARAAEPETVKVDLAAAGSPWHFSDDRASIVSGELRLDATSSPTYAFFKGPAFGDVSLSAKFMVEPHSGVKAVGFVIGSTDSVTFQYVHYDANSAILCLSDVNEEWREIKRASKPHEPGKWYSAKLERKGNRLGVYFEDKLLFEAEAEGEAGWIGFYASQTVGHVKDIEITGTPVALAKPWTPIKRPQTWVHVCTDARGGYEAFPDVCRMADGRLVAVFYAGYGHVAMPNEKLPKGGRISYCTSSDEGQTWSAAQTLFDGPYDDRDPSIVQLKDGRMICNFFTLKPKQGGSWEGLGSWMVVSGDGGKTWQTEPQQIAKNYYCSAPIRELPDGRLMLGLYAEEPSGSWGAVTVSEDGGKTWCQPIDIPNGGMRLDAETDVIQLRDGAVSPRFEGLASPPGRSARTAARPGRWPSSSASRAIATTCTARGRYHPDGPSPARDKPALQLGRGQDVEPERAGRYSGRRLPEHGHAERRHDPDRLLRGRRRLQYSGETVPRNARRDRVLADRAGQVRSAGNRHGSGEPCYGKSKKPLPHGQSSNSRVVPRGTSTRRCSPWSTVIGRGRPSSRSTMRRISKGRSARRMFVSASAASWLMTNSTPRSGLARTTASMSGFRRIDAGAHAGGVAHVLQDAWRSSARAAGRSC